MAKSTRTILIETIADILCDKVDDLEFINLVAERMAERNNFFRVGHFARTEKTHVNATTE